MENVCAMTFEMSCTWVYGKPSNCCHYIYLFICCNVRSLAVGTKEGYRLFSVTAVDKLECIHESGKQNF